jgi:hypothetical protein
MAKLRPQQEQSLFDFGTASIPTTSGNALVSNADLPRPPPEPIPPPSPTPSNPAGDVPVPAPLESAVRRGVFGTDEHDDPVEPSEDEVHEISLLHGERLAELFQSLDHVGKQLRRLNGSGLEKLVREKERLTCQVQGMLALYAEDFGETAARHLESWARAEVSRKDDALDVPSCPLQANPLAPDGPQYGPGHPWHYLVRGDAARPVSVDEIPVAECDGTFVGRLPKDTVKRRAKLSQLLVDQTRQLDDDKSKYRDVLEHGANSLSEYDRDIA